METREICFAAGCFWGTERLFQCIQGVLDTECGFANGKKDWENLTYERVCQGDTGAREAVRVCYDPGQVTLPQLLKAYFLVIDPTVFDRQGPDIGSQYQSGIYFSDKASQDTVLRYAAEVAENYPVFAVELLPLDRFTPADEYHQDYLKKNPGGYCHISPALFHTIDDYIRK